MQKPMRRTAVRQREPGELIAFDLETTPIDVGTPELLYYTQYDGYRLISRRLTGTRDLADIIVGQLNEETVNARFVGWNANRFDGRFITAAVTEHYPDYVIHPYLTKSGTLRGFHIALKYAPRVRWYFLDGIAMTGLVGTGLGAFTKAYAPMYTKHDVDLSKETFDPNNAAHVAYAENDAVGLWHAISEAERIVRDLTGMALKPTIGNLGIRFFMANMPKEKQVWRPPRPVQDAVYGSVLRGGYCWCARQYHGHADKFDVNQAYAGAMRTTQLPCGPITHSRRAYMGDTPAIYHVTISRDTRTRVPFLIRRCDRVTPWTTVQGKPVFTDGAAVTGWITSDEYRYLVTHKWRVEIHDGWYWGDSFTMADMVDRLEHLRSTCVGGPKGAVGMMVKAIGNNAYGKTLERLDGVQYVVSMTEPPPERDKAGALQRYVPHMPENDAMRYVWRREADDMTKPYHQPQIGAFITAAVRVQVMTAAMLREDDFLYADTDCVVFVHRDTVPFETDSARYGMFKVEAIGHEMVFIAKKVYADIDEGDKGIHAKGLRTRELTITDMLDWYNGIIPKQTQVQLQAFLRVNGAMFRALTRRGTDVRNLTGVTLENREFIPIVSRE